MSELNCCGVAGGIRVELDDSRCVVLRQGRTQGPDLVLTVTDVEGLRAALADALVMQKVYEDMVHHQTKESTR